MKITKKSQLKVGEKYYSLYMHHTYHRCVLKEWELKKINKNSQVWICTREWTGLKFEKEDEFDWEFNCLNSDALDGSGYDLEYFDSIEDVKQKLVEEIQSQINDGLAKIKAINKNCK